MSQFPIRNENNQTAFPFTEADKHRLTTDPALQEINAKDKGKDRRKYRVRVWDHKTQKECWKVSLKCSKGIPLWVDRGIEIAQKVAIAHNQEQIRKTEMRVDWDGKERWQKEGAMSLDDIYRAYVERKRALGGRGGWGEGARADKMEEQGWNKVSIIKKALPEVLILSDIINYDPRNDCLIQNDFELRLETMRKKDGTRYAVDTLNGIGTFFKGLLSVLQQLRLLPREYAIRPYRNLPQRNGEATVKEKIQGREEFELIYNSIKTQPILEPGKKKRLDDPRRMLVAAEMWKFQCYSGLRIGETRLLNWGDIGEGSDPTGKHWEHGYINLTRIQDSIKRSHGVCTRKWLILPLFAEAKEALIELQRLGHPLTGISCCSPQEEIFPGTLRWYTERVPLWAQNAYRTVGIERSFPSHTTRTYAIDHAESLGWSQQEISCYFGNSQRTRDKAYNSHLQGPSTGLMMNTVPTSPSTSGVMKGQVLEGRFLSA